MTVTACPGRRALTPTPLPLSAVEWLDITDSAFATTETDRKPPRARPVIDALHKGRRNPDLGRSRTRARRAVAADADR